MKRFTTNLLAAALGVGAIFATVADSQACPRSGGGGSSYRSYYRPAPTYYQQPTYAKPCPVQVAQPQPVPQQTVQSIPQQSVQNAPQGLPPVVQRTASALPARVATQARPVTANVTRSTPPSTQSAAASPATTNNAQMTALQLLAGLSSGQTQSQPAAPTPQPEQPAAGHVGNWTASLPNNTTVQLSLQADGTFAWNATSNGKSSEFRGTFRLQNETLTLVRSSDNQQLVGTFTPSANGGFNFKLNGAKDSGLDFTRG